MVVRDWLDDIEAEMDETVPHYVPRLVKEIRRFREAAPPQDAPKSDHGGCTVPPEGWYCTRERGHDGPCATWPSDGALSHVLRGAAPPAEGEALRRKLRSLEADRDSWRRVADRRESERIQLWEALRVARRWIVEDGAEAGWDVDRLQDVLDATARATQGEPAPSETHVEVTLTHGVRRWQARIEQPATGRDWYHEIHQAIQRVLGEPAPSPQPADLDLLGSSATGSAEARRHAERAGMTLAQKHAARLREEIASHGCPYALAAVGEDAYCPTCADKWQVARLLDGAEARRHAEATEIIEGFVKAFNGRSLARGDWPLMDRAVDWIGGAS